LLYNSPIFVNTGSSISFAGPALCTRWSVIRGCSSVISQSGIGGMVYMSRTTRRLVTRTLYMEVFLIKRSTSDLSQFETPIALTLPVLRSCSIALYVCVGVSVLDALARRLETRRGTISDEGWEAGHGEYRHCRRMLQSSHPSSEIVPRLVSRRRASASGTDQRSPFPDRLVIAAEPMLRRPGGACCSIAWVQH
jgi:hypothetical protein